MLPFLFSSLREAIRVNKKRTRHARRQRVQEGRARNRRVQLEFLEQRTVLDGELGYAITVDFDSGPAVSNPNSGNENFSVSESLANPAALNVAFDGSGNLLIQDIGVVGSEQANDLTVKRIGSDLVLTDPSQTFFQVPAGGVVSNNGHTLTLPFAAVTGSLTFNAGSGNDKLTIDLSGGDVIPAGGITYDGGAPTTGLGDSLAIVGGNQGTVTYNYVNASDGSIVLSNYGTVTYIGLEPITNSGSATDVVFNLPAAVNAVSLVDDGVAGNGLSTMAGATFEDTTFANPSGSITINRGNAGDTLTFAALPDLTASLALGAAATPFSTITFNGQLTIAANQNLAAFASGSIALPLTTSQLSTSGTGTISLTTAQNISLATGASLTTENGNLTLSANLQTTPTAGGFTGIDIVGATVRSLGTGDVTLSGRGGQLTGSSNLHGIAIDGTTAKVSSASGAVRLTGTGGGTGTSKSNNGVQVTGGAEISAGGAGGVAVQGTGGNLTGSGGSNVGVRLAGTGTLITASAGPLGVVGTGGGGSATGNNHGVSVNGGSISATGTSALTVTGTGPNDSGTGNFGVYATTAASQITAGAGGGVVTAKALRPGTIALEMSASASIVTSSGSPLAIEADRINIDSTVTISAGTGTLSVYPTTASQYINLGSADAGNPLCLSDIELDRMTGGTLIIGSPTTLGLTAYSSITRPSATNLILRSGGDVSIYALVNTASGSLTVQAPRFTTDDAALEVSSAQTTITAGTALVTGFTSSTSYDRLSVNGALNLTSARLTLAGFHIPKATDSFLIVEKNGTDPIVGTFEGLPEGTLIPFNQSMLQITYVGGTGNDIVLTPVKFFPTITSNGGGATASISLLTGTPVVTTVTATDVDLPPETMIYSIVGGADQSKFTIDSQTGVLRFVTPPRWTFPDDAGANNVYDVIVQVSDGYGTDTQAIAITIGNVLNVNGRDLIFDPVRQQLLITTDQKIQRFDEATSTMVADLSVAASLYGGDVSPDGNFVYVAGSETGMGSQIARIYKVNLATGATSIIQYSIATGEAGAIDVGIDANGKAIVTGFLNGPGTSPMRQLDTATNQVTLLGSLPTHWQSTAYWSADRTRVLLHETSTTAYGISTYSTITGFSPAYNTNGARGAAVSRDGSLMAVVVDHNTVVFDAQFHPVREIYNVQGGMAFHPNQDLLLVLDRTEVVAYDTNTWVERYRVPIGEDVFFPTAGSMNMLAFNSAGTRLYFDSSTVGLRLIDLPNPTNVATRATLSDYSIYVANGYNNSLAVTMRDPTGEVVTNFTGTVQFTSNDPAAVLPASYTFAPADAGKHTFQFSLSTAGNRTVTVTTSGGPALSATTSTIQVHTAATTSLPLTNVEDMTFDSVRNMLYLTTSDGRVQRYSMVQDSLLTPWNFGGALAGLDTTPSDSTLYVMNDLKNAVENSVYKIDLATGNRTRLNYRITDSPVSGGLLTIDANGKASAGTSYRMMDFDTTTTEVFTANPDFTLYNQVRGADRSKLLVLANSYRIGVKTVATGSTVMKTLTSYQSDSAAVSPNGSLFAMERNDEMVAVFDGNLQAVKQLLGVAGGVIFHPTQPILLAVDLVNDQVVAFDTNTWQERYRLPIGQDVSEKTQLEISADGSKLFINTYISLRVVNLPAASGVASNVALSGFGPYQSAGVPFSITVSMLDPSGNVATGYTGTVRITNTFSGSTLLPDYTFTPADAGQHTFTFTASSSGNWGARFVDIAQPTLTKSSGTISVHSGISTLIPMTGVRDLVYNSVRNELYVSTSTGLIQRYSAATDSLLAPWPVSHSLYGIDVTPDGNTVLAQEGARNMAQGVVNELDVATGQITLLRTDVEYYETGGWDVVIGPDGRGLGSITNSSDSVTELRYLDPVTNLVSDAPFINTVSETHLARNNNRSRFVVMNANSNSILGLITPGSSTYTAVVNTGSGVDLTNAFASVNLTGTFTALSRPGTLEIRNSSLAVVKTIANVYGGVAFKPGTNLLYAVNSSLNNVQVYDGGNNWNLLSTISLPNSIGSVAPMSNGALAFSDNGARLFLTTVDGVRMFITGDITAPTITIPPGNQTILEDANTGLLPFTVGDETTAAGSLTLSATSSNEALVPVGNITFGGTGASRTVRITPAANQNGGPVSITVTVRDAALNATSFKLDLTVTAVNDVPSFVKGANPTVLMNALPQAVAGWATAISPGPANESSQTVSFQVTNNTNSSLFAAGPVIAADGTLSFTPAAGAFGAATLTIAVQDSGGTASGGVDTSATQTFTITVLPTLQVSSLLPTTTGVVVNFNRDFDATTLNLYDVQAGTLGPADIVLIGGTVGPIRGSAVVDPIARRITFVATGGNLPPDNYTLSLRSAANGLRDSAGGLLDGDANGFAGGDFVTNFTVTAPAANTVTVGIPNFSRGPQQSVNVPASGTSGIPITISDGSGITAATLEVRYNPALLTITAASVSAGLPVGATVNLDTSTAGVAIITFSSPSPLAAGATRLVDLQATVPGTAAYQSKQVVDVANVVLNGGAIPAIDDDGVQVVAYFGDVTANGTYSAQDAAIVARLAVGLDGGLAPFKLLDPSIIADINGNGSFSATDTSRMLQAAVGIATPEIPPLPQPAVSLLSGGPDPKLSIPRNLAATAGQALSIPVDIDSIVDLTGNGLSSADLVLYYDPLVLDVQRVALGSLLKSLDGWVIASRIDPLAGRIDISLASSIPLAGKFLGELVKLQATVRADARGGVSAINLAATSRSRSTQLNEGFLTLIPAPTDTANDPIDGLVTITPATLPATATARLVDNRLLIIGTQMDDLLLIKPTADGSQVVVRAGNRLLGTFARPASIAIDGMSGHDYVYVDPAAPAAVIATTDEPTTAEDVIFTGDNARLVASPAVAVTATMNSTPSLSLHDLALLHLLDQLRGSTEETAGGGTLRRRR